MGICDKINDLTDKITRLSEDIKESNEKVGNLTIFLLLWTILIAIIGVTQAFGIYYQLKMGNSTDAQSYFYTVLGVYICTGFLIILAVVYIRSLRK